MKSTYKNWIASKLIPFNFYGDYLHAYVNHVRVHRSFPRLHGRKFEDRIFTKKVLMDVKNPIYEVTTDKELVKNYIKGALGADYTPRTIHVFENENQLRKYKFNEIGILKPTHLSGYTEFVTSLPANIDMGILNWFKLNHYNATRERNYRYLSPKIIFEEFAFGVSELQDYKFFCVNGRVKFIQVDVDRHIKHRRVLLDREWNSLGVSLKYPLFEGSLIKPICLNELLDAVEILAQPFDFVRVDAYVKDRQFLFGEITHVHGAGYEKFNPISSRGRVDGLLD